LVINVQTDISLEDLTTLTTVNVIYMVEGND